MCKDENCEKCPDGETDCLLKAPRTRIIDFAGMTKEEIPLENLIKLLDEKECLSPQLEKLIREADAAGKPIFLIEIEFLTRSSMVRKESSQSLEERIANLNPDFLYNAGVAVYEENAINLLEDLLAEAAENKDLLAQLAAGIRSIRWDVRDRFIQVDIPVLYLRKLINRINDSSSQIKWYLNTQNGGKITEIGLMLDDNIIEKIRSAR